MREPPRGRICPIHSKDFIVKTDRINPYKTAPDAMKAMMRVERYLRDCGLEASLVELVKMRASQLNGFAYCIDLHSKDARLAGEASSGFTC